MLAGDAALTIEALVDRIVLAKSADNVWEAAQLYFSEHGFDRLIYADLTGAEPVLRNSFPDGFGEYYADVCNPADDPFFRYCCATLAPIGTGLDYVDDYPYLSASERQIIETARGAGMRSGFSCTFQLNGKSGMGGWNIGSTLARDQIESITSDQGHTLRLAALFAHERMIALQHTTVTPTTTKLSPREHDCLVYLAAGMKTQQIADALGIKTVTVELHLRRARERLGARTREQALAKALSLQMLRI